MKVKKPRHLNTNKITVKYKCKHCDQAFNSRTTRTNHQKSHNKKQHAISRKICTCGIYINSNDKHRHLKTKLHTNIIKVP